jgi:serine/threonine protein kinase
LSLDAFEKGALIAEGGAGRVFEGRHRATGEAVAIKLLTTGGKPGQRAAFQREAHAMARFDHPHLLPVYEYGHTLEGQPFMVMPLAEHGDLHRYVKRLDWVTAGTILVQVLEGLAHAHAHGVVHCDLKPENVLLRSAQGGVRAQLADFGIAQALRNTADSGSIRGTPHYMAPEQLIETALIGPTTDIYALGCITYELTARSLPFEGATPLAIGTAQVSQTPAPWEDATGAPAGLEQWIMRCLAKEPRARWPGAAEALAALRPLIPRGVAVLPEPDPDAGADSTQGSRPGLTRAPPPARQTEISTRLAPPDSWMPRRARTERVGLGLRLFGVRSRPLVGRDAAADVIWRRARTRATAPGWWWWRAPRGPARVIWLSGWASAPMRWGSRGWPAPAMPTPPRIRAG